MEDVRRTEDPVTEEQRAALERRRRGSLWTVAWILYGTLGLLFIAMPSQVASRLDDFPSTPIVRGVQQGVLAVAAASDRVGLEPLHRMLRRSFLTAFNLGGS